MKKHVLLSCLCLLLLVSLAAAPVLAATVTCPSSCSCLLPAEAKKIGSPGYCQGQQKVCAYDAQKNPKYCYEKPVTTTTTDVQQKCASGCSCLSSADGKGKGLLYCNGKQTVCGYSGNTPLYCFAPPITTTITTTITPQNCASGCTCLIADEGKEKGLDLCGGRQVFCGYSGNTRMYCFDKPKPTDNVMAADSNLRIITTTPTISPGTQGQWSDGLGNTSPESYTEIRSCTAPCTCLAPADPIVASDIQRCGDASTPPCGIDKEGNYQYCYSVKQAIPQSLPPKEESFTPLGIVNSFLGLLGGLFGHPAPKSPTIEKPTNQVSDPDLVRPVYSYQVATIINPGAAVYIGEENLNVTNAMVAICHTLGPSLSGGPLVPGATKIGWYASGSDPYSTAPAKIIDLRTGYRFQDLLISPADFVGYEGNWYLLYTDGSAPIGDHGPLFIVRDPAISLSVTSAATGASVSGATVRTGDQLRFSIPKNIGVAGTAAILREPLTNSVNDGFMDIVVIAPGGRTLSKLDVISGSATDEVSLSRPCWELPPDSTCNPPFTWNTGATYSNGTVKYPPGTYTVQVISKLNNMHHNYLNSGALYEGKTASQRITFTLT